MLECGVSSSHSHTSLCFAWHWYLASTSLTAHTVTAHTLTLSTLHHMVALFLVYSIELSWTTIWVFIVFKNWVGVVLFIAIGNLFVYGSTQAVSIVWFHAHIAHWVVLNCWELLHLSVPAFVYRCCFVNNETTTHYENICSADSLSLLFLFPAFPQHPTSYSQSNNKSY